MRTKTIICTCLITAVLLCLTIGAEVCPRISPSERVQVLSNPLAVMEVDGPESAQRALGLPGGMRDGTPLSTSQETAGGKGHTNTAVSVSEQGSVTQRYGIPAYENLVSSVTEDELSSYQMFRKASVLGIDPHTLNNPGELQDALISQADALYAGAFLTARTVTFSGSTAAELQECIDAHTGDLVLLSSDVKLDASIFLPSDTALDGAGHALICNLEGPTLVVQRIENVSVRDLRIEGKADCGFVVSDATHVVIENVTVKGMQSKAAVFAGSCEGFVIKACDFSENLRGGIMFTGDCSQGLVSDCIISHNKGCSNLMAGMVLTQTVHDDPFNLWEGYMGEEPHWPRRGRLEDLLATPHDIAMVGNAIEGNQSSGIYLDGAYRCFVDKSSIVGNDKEGMCLDYGTIACWVHDTLFEDNGRRIRQTEESLRLDYVDQFGLMEDGSSIAKLPAVSLDNALYNVVEGNRVVRNWGGGIKCVRTAVRNTIAGNVILDCNEGENDTFDFIGIEVGNALEETEEPYMDFSPDLENIVVGNYVLGHHYIGIFLSAESAGNLVERNVVEGPWRGSFVDISTRDNVMQHDLVGTAARMYHYVRG